MKLAAMRCEIIHGIDDGGGVRGGIARYVNIVVICTCIEIVEMTEMR